MNNMKNATVLLLFAGIAMHTLAIADVTREAPIRLAGFFDGITDALSNVNKSITESLPRDTQPTTEKQTEKENAAVSPQTAASPQIKLFAQQPAPEILKPSKSYRGYSKNYMPVRSMLYKGNFLEAADFYEKAKNSPPPPAPKSDPTEMAGTGGNSENEALSENAMPIVDFQSDSLGQLHFLEMGTLLLDSGKVAKSADAFLAVRQFNIKDDNTSVTAGWFKKIALGAGELIVGQEEMQPFKAASYEQVMMLNYQALAYLLEGKHDAYNITRQAIDKQNQERDAFLKKMEEEKQKLAVNIEKQKVEFSKQPVKKGTGASENALTSPDEISNEVTKPYAEYHTMAQRVSSAYVNPFADYLAGIVMEFDAYENTASLDDASRAYRNALELNPESAVIKQSLADIEAIEENGAKAGSRQRVIHIVAADGYAPERKLLVNYLPLPKAIVAVKLPLLEPVENKVDRIELQDANGKLLADFSLVTDIEGMAMRSQMDSEPELQLRAILAVAASYFIQHKLGQAIPFGQLIGMARDDAAHPDTRSWASLPSRMLAAKLNLPPDIQMVRIVSFDSQGEMLGKVDVKLSNGNGFVYVRSANGNLLAHVAKTIWSN